MTDFLFSGTISSLTASEFTKNNLGADITTMPTSYSRPWSLVVGKNRMSREFLADSASTRGSATAMWLGKVSTLEICMGTPRVHLRTLASNALRCDAITRLGEAVSQSDSIWSHR